MALTERQEEDKIEILGEFKIIQVRTADIIERDGTEISRTFHRYMLTPDKDVSDQSPEVQAIATALWTDELKASYQAHLDSLEDVE
jgi:hypothetical protein